ncbi:MAG: GumC family protein [Pseudomonadales bacterium]
MNPFDYPMQLNDYWAILRRRKAHFLLPFAAVVAIALALALLLPPTYRSEATFLIQRQTIPENMVATTVTGYVEEQIEQIRQNLLTRRNLLEIAEQFQLYGDLPQRDPNAVIERLREAVDIEMVDVRTSNRESRGQNVTIAFTLAFHASTPEFAQRVTAELSERFLAEHQTRRDVQATQVSGFLEREAAKLAEEISAMELALAGFKQDELHQLPELMTTNLRMFERTEQDIENAQERIRELQERIEVARAELSLTPPYEAVQNESGERILTASQRLSMLTAEYLRASARYSAQHPDIVRTAREIRVLAEQLGTDGRADEMMNELVGLQEQLRQARQRYADSHPEVTRLERAVAAVQRGFQQELLADADTAASARRPPDNPRYVALKTQMDSHEMNLAAERRRLEDLNVRLEEYERRLFQTPVVERDFRSLSRNYDNALQQYHQLRDKQRQALLAQELESGDSGERFLLTSAAFLPRMPESPNRIAIMLLGMFFASAIGIGVVGVSEYLDQTVRNAKMVAVSLGAPPLVVIPQMAAATHGPQGRLLHHGY